MQKNIEKKKENLEKVDNQIKWRFSFSGEKLNADTLIEINNFVVQNSTDNPLYKISRLHINPSEKIAILGNNGVGKTTFIKSLWNTYCDNKDKKDIFIHSKSKIGYFDQNLKQVNISKNLLDTIEQYFNEIKVSMSSDNIFNSLISSGFNYEELNKPFSVLSLGEKSRLMFICLSLLQANFFILDEPTNYLDIYGKQQLKKALQDFPGGCLIVSHDRDLIEKVCNKFIVIHDNKATEFLDIQKAYKFFK